MPVTRFAPSPNGGLHLGHAYAAIRAHDLAEDAKGGQFLLRIEDIDGARSRSELAEAFRADLAWLGLRYREVPPQSTRLAAYARAAEQLENQGLLYRCICTRADIAQASRHMPVGTGHPIYPGTCKDRNIDPKKPHTMRLNVAEAMRRTGSLTWNDAVAGEQQARPDLLGDVVLVRKDDPASYHLAVTLDDARDAISLVTRGTDLFAATHIHRLLQALLSLPVPQWHHHRLIVDDEGRKLAKRRGSQSLADLRRHGMDGEALAADLRAARLPAGLFLDPS